MYMPWAWIFSPFGADARRTAYFHLNLAFGPGLIFGLPAAVRNPSDDFLPYLCAAIGCVLMFIFCWWLATRSHRYRWLAVTVVLMLSVTSSLLLFIAT